MEKNVVVKLKKVNLSQIRKKLNITQEELSQLLDIPRTTLSKFESGSRSLDWIEKAVKLQKLLKEAGYSLEDLAVPPYDENN